MGISVRLAKWLLLSLVAVAVMLGATYLYLRTSTVLVQNRSNVKILNLQVELGGETFWQGTLESGESHRAFGFVTPDDIGNLVISFSTNGVAHKNIFPSDSMTYGAHHRLTITPTLEVKCEWDGEACDEAYGPLKLSEITG